MLLIGRRNCNKIISIHLSSCKAKKGQDYRLKKDEGFMTEAMGSQHNSIYHNKNGKEMAIARMGSDEMFLLKAKAE